MDKTEIAALLALSSALCVAIGDVLQQRAAHGIADRSVGPVELFAHLLRSQRWWWGALLLVASIALQAAALGGGSVLLVQALLTSSVLFALPINARLSHRAVTGGEWMWAALLTAAVIVVVIVGNPQAGHSGASLRTWARGGGGPWAVVGRLRGGRPDAGWCGGRRAVRFRVRVAVGHLRGAHEGSRRSAGRRRRGGRPDP